MKTRAIRVGPYLLTAALLAILPASSALAADAIVPDNFGTIAAAINGATDLNANGTVEILVRAGTYRENLLIERSNLSLTGEAPATTIIRGSGLFDTVRIEHSMNVKISRFTITGDMGGDGLELSDAVSCTVNGNIFVGNFRGISLGRSSGNRIIRNEIFNNRGTGLKIARTSNGNAVARNVVHENGNHGIDVIGSTGNIVQSNILSLNVGNGIRVGLASLTTIAMNTISGSGNDGIRIGRVSDVTLSANQATGSVENGLRMEETTRTLVSHNAFTGNQGYGVRRKLWVDDDFDGGLAGIQAPPGDNDLSGNVLGPLRED